MREKVDRLIDQFLKVAKQQAEEAFQVMVVRLQQIRTLREDESDYLAIIGSLLSLFRKNFDIGRLKSVWDNSILYLYFADWEQPTNFVNEEIMNLFVYYSQMSMQILNNLDTNIAEKIRVTLEKARSSTKMIEEMDTLLLFAINKLNMIAETEFHKIAIHGQLDNFKRKGITKVRYFTEEDERVCPICRPLHGKIMLLSEAYGLIPRHVNCRCFFEAIE